MSCFHQQTYIFSKEKKNLHAVQPYTIYLFFHTGGLCIIYIDQRSYIDSNASNVLSRHLRYFLAVIPSIAFSINPPRVIFTNFKKKKNK